MFISNVSFLDQEDFTPESIELVKATILGSCFKAIVTGYHYDNTPFIQLTKRFGHVIIYKKGKYIFILFYLVTSC